MTQKTMKLFEPTFESLRSYQCPQWFGDAKLGFWSHWGPQSVPMAGDWYARNMYIEGTPQYLHHLRTYGHPSEFGYKDICKLWKAENFDPDYLMNLYSKAGARFFAAQVAHHDNFFNFPSKYNNMNAAQVGPMKDICGLWKGASDKFNLPFGLAEHFGRSFAWWNVNKGSDAYGPFAGVPYDGNDVRYKTFYHENQEHTGAYMTVGASKPQYTLNAKYHKYWLNVMKELIDMYSPELVYTDGGLPFGELFTDSDTNPAYDAGLEMVAYLYNSSIKKHGENRCVYTQKDDRKEIYSIGTYDIESSKLPGINPLPWQTEICIGPWYYDTRKAYEKPSEVIDFFIDVVSKNGTMLLNIPQLPDGSLDGESLYFLEEFTKWIAISGTAIFGTKPWKLHSEGSYRFTSKGDTIYVFMPEVSQDNVAVIRSFNEGERVLSVSLLGDGRLDFAQEFGVLTVKLPSMLPTKYVNCVEIKLNNR